jgi:hypothetical protein
MRDDEVIVYKIEISLSFATCKTAVATITYD